MHPTANRKNPLSVSGEPAIKALWHLAHLKLRPGGVRAVTTAPVGLAVLCPPKVFWRLDFGAQWTARPTLLCAIAPLH